MISFPSEKVTAVVLGIMQDGGLPHIGCRCLACTAAYANPWRAEYAASLALIDNRGDETAVWLIDATPDIKYQLNLLAQALGPHPTQPERLRQPDAIFITHAHMGHVGGLTQLGPEAMAVQRLPVYADRGLAALLRENRLWRPLMNQVDLRPLPANERVTLSPGLDITPLPVPHRDELGTGTFAFYVRGPKRSLLYVPDIDAWELWPVARDYLAATDIALVDACFYSTAELGGRPPVAHPLVPHTLALFADLPGQLVLTHINHTNPILDESSQERAALAAMGAKIAYTGQTFTL